MKAIRHDDIRTYQQYKETILWFYTTIGKGVPKAFVDWIASEESDELLKGLFEEYNDGFERYPNYQRDYKSIQFQCIELSY